MSGSRILAKVTDLARQVIKFFLKEKSILCILLSFLSNQANLGRLIKSVFPIFP